MSTIRACLAVTLVTCSFLASCTRDDYNRGLVHELQQLTEADMPKVPPAIGKAVRAFYEQRSFAPAWVEGKHAGEHAAEALVALRQASDHGFDPADYGEAEIIEQHASLERSDKDAPDRQRALAQFDVRLTSALIALGRDVALGPDDPRQPNVPWKASRKAPDLVGTLAEAVKGKSVTKWLDSVRPVHPEYHALQQALVSLRGQKAKGGWPKVAGATGKGRQATADQQALQQRLIAGGHLKTDGSTPPSDDDIAAAIRAFQDLHAIKATGRLDGPTLAAMNVPIEARIAQVEVNMDRWRWMADDLGARHFFVNIPHFHLLAREQGKPVMDIRVVVGKPGNETPIFSDEMEVVVFSPYWNIPDTIVAGETAPAVARDPGYLERNNIEVLRNGRVVSPISVNWSDPSTLRALAFRQRPGASNALGHVKFLFPNEHDVYLHDTPADALFARTGRAFSHGCVRVEEPEVLAQYVLRDRSEWTPDAIRRAMHSGVEKHVKLDAKIPVHIVYFTAWVDERGGLHFQPDIYGYDDRQLGRSSPAVKAARS